MKNLIAAGILAALIAAPSASRAEDITRFTPLKAEELTPSQKAWADMIAAPPRNAKFTAPPYRAYIRNPDLAPRLSALSEYLRWNTSLPPRLSELAILITARQSPRLGRRRRCAEQIALHLADGCDVHHPLRR